MSRRSLSSICVLALAAGLVVTPAQALAQPAPSSVDNLAADVAQMSRPGAGSAGTVGVASWRLDGHGPRLLVHADDAFPMASTFKVAVAGAVMQRVQAGTLSLDRMVTIDPDRMVDSEVIADRFVHPGVALSVYNLMELMLTQSDNTATDYMVELAGGPAAVTAWVRAQGVEGLRVDGDTDEIIRRFYHMETGVPFPRALADKIKADPNADAESLLPQREFDSDPRDTTSPREMAELLTKIYGGKTSLNGESTKVIEAIMARCRTGVNRLRGMMPPGTVMYDKTGTIGGSVNDVGVIVLPDGGEVVVAVYIKGSDASEDVREKTIAQIGRAVRDYYAYGGS